MLPPDVSHGTHQELARAALQHTDAEQVAMLVRLIKVPAKENAWMRTFRRENGTAMGKEQQQNTDVTNSLNLPPVSGEKKN